MKKINNKELKLLEQICRLPQYDLMDLMVAFLQKHYKEVKHTYDYIIAEGDIPIALVAHMDTVFDKLPAEIYYDQNKGMMWSPQGLGADDRAGVYAIIQIIQKGYKPSIILTTDEEIGGLGARWLVGDLSTCPFKDCKYIIELDRRGTNDAVFYDCINQDFIDYIEQFGFCETPGIYSDICEICPIWKIAGVNLSVGYFDEHDKIERLKVPALLQTIDKVCKLLLDEKNAPAFEYKCYPGVESYYYKRHSTFFRDVLTTLNFDD